MCQPLVHGALPGLHCMENPIFQGLGARTQGALGSILWPFTEEPWEQPWGGVAKPETDRPAGGLGLTQGIYLHLPRAIYLPGH
jgi:hypothetical protein